MKPSCHRIHGSARPWRVRISHQESGSPLRQQLEALIRQRYLDAYGATIEHFHPLLLGLESTNGRLAGAIGAQPAGSTSRLFLETYLDRPIEAEIASRVGSIARDSIYEVGNLAGTAAGSGPALITGLAEYLGGAGAEWVAFTATSGLWVSLDKLGVELIDLGLADPTRLGSDRSTWGRYYETVPRLAAANLLRLHEAVTGSRLEGRLGGVWTDARQQGAAHRRAS